MAEPDHQVKSDPWALAEVAERLSRSVVSHNTMRRFLGLKSLCGNCNQPIKIQIFQGTDWCSDDCRKALQKSND